MWRVSEPMKVTLTRSLFHSRSHSFAHRDVAPSHTPSHMRSLIHSDPQITLVSLWLVACTITLWVHPFVTDGELVEKVTNT